MLCGSSAGLILRPDLVDGEVEEPHLDGKEGLQIVLAVELVVTKSSLCGGGSNAAGSRCCLPCGCLPLCELGISITTEPQPPS